MSRTLKLKASRSITVRDDRFEDLRGCPDEVAWRKTQKVSAPERVTMESWCKFLSVQTEFELERENGVSMLLSDLQGKPTMEGRVLLSYIEWCKNPEQDCAPSRLRQRMKVLRAFFREHRMGPEGDGAFEYPMIKRAIERTTTITTEVAAKISRAKLAYQTYVLVVQEALDSDVLRAFVRRLTRPQLQD